MKCLIFYLPAADINELEKGDKSCWRGKEQNKAWLAACRCSGGGFTEAKAIPAL